MRIGCLVVAFVLCLMSLASPAAAAITLVEEVRVRIYDTAGLSAQTKRSALAVAGAALAAASADVFWQHCPRADTERKCATPVRSGELVLRIVRAAKGPPGRSGAATLRAGASLSLGDAFIDHGSASGVLATVYFDGVSLLASVAGIDQAVLLGYAIAHEVGHLLLASGGHGSHGLMRANWSAEELRLGRTADWRFTAQESAAIRSRLEAARIAARGLTSDSRTPRPQHDPR
jgi:hypothetical protein